MYDKASPEQLREENSRLRAALDKIAGKCLGSDSGVVSVAWIHKTAVRALEHPDWNSYELGTDEQRGET